jgi:CRISPR-associated protein (TIGR03984 family)
MNTKLCQSLPVDETFQTDPGAWLARQMSAEMPYLLAHADDGAIWGRREADGSLKLSGELFQEVKVGLRAETLLQARVFGPGGEVLVWRTDAGFAARSIQDGQTSAFDALPDERHLLWRLGRVETRQGFTLMEEGEQGQRHAPPVVPRGDRRPALVVRHYVRYDDEGQAYVATSRLVDLEV